MRFILTLFVGLMVLATLEPWLTRIGIGRLPGDLNFKWGKRTLCVPLASTLLLTLGLWLVGRLV